MENFMAALAGILAGFLYTEHIHRQSRVFPRRKPLLSFWVRFLSVGVAGVVVLRLTNIHGFMYFSLGFLLSLFANTLRRGIRIK